MKTDAWKTLSAVTASLLLASGAAVAGDDSSMSGPQSSKSPSFEELDQDGNGKISKEEAGQHDQLSQKFDEIDADENDELDKGEFARFEAEGDSKPKSQDRGASPSGSQQGGRTAPGTSQP